jgi:stringent starvation protein B
MNVDSTKPYLIRSIYDWCIDSDFTPFISVKVYPGFDMPEYVKNEEVVLNISAKAIHDLVISNDIVCFMARFNGIPKKIEIPMSAIKSIFAKEVNQGIVFAVPDKEDEGRRTLSNEESNAIPDSDSLVNQSKNISKPNLRIIK